ncbi:Hypothetical protein Minf_1143 [Methylacidiphilum infernorum V4]|uniref:Uncharacterized protein n=1 Tax=Methylacidiphilum infernorum (isolate V4) TaxID=481448 RepID=B3DV45_METI4|nr:Hypothetical protein Minf_1143 [Methylacidiphilum infernorum V4]
MSHSLRMAFLTIQVKWKNFQLLFCFSSRKGFQRVEE